MYALPNLFPTQPAIQIAFTDSGKSADQSLKDEIDSIILENSIKADEVFLRDNKLVLKFTEQMNNLKQNQLFKKLYLIKSLLLLILSHQHPTG